MILTDKHFIDWENHVFGYGYGTGEPHTLKALHDFIQLVPLDGTYDFRLLESELTPIVTWLMINILVPESILDYGVSPRFGWLTDKGKLLKLFLYGKSLDELIALVNTDDDYIYCHSDICNCDTPCDNPLF